MFATVQMRFLGKNYSPTFSPDARGFFTGRDNVDTNGAREYHVTLQFMFLPIMPSAAERIIRCPYRRVGNEVRPMAIGIEGWLQVAVHSAMLPSRTRSEP